MDVGNNLGQSFNYTKKLFDDLGQLLLLIIISIIPIVNFIMLGYVVQVAKETPGSTHPPKLTNYGALFIEGLKVVVVGIIYMIIPAILLGVSVLPSLFSLHMPIIGALTIILAILGIVIAFFISIILYMAIVNMAKYGSISKAFAINEILGMIKRVGWGNYILWIIALFIIMVIVGAIGTIPFVGWLISLILAPAVATFTFRSAALVYSEGTTGAQQFTPYAAPPPPPPPPLPTGVQSGKIFCTRCGVET